MRSLGGCIRHQQPTLEPWGRLLPCNKDGQLSRKETPHVVPDIIAAAQGAELCPLQSEKAFSFNTLRMSYKPSLGCILLSLYVVFKSVERAEYFPFTIHSSTHHLGTHSTIYPLNYSLTYHPPTHPPTSFVHFITIYQAPATPTAGLGSEYTG